MAISLVPPVVIFIIISLVIVQSQENFPLIAPAKFLREISPRISTCGGLTGPKCLDCSTLMTCIGLNTPIATTKCVDMDPSRPYCDKTRCSAIPNQDDDNCRTQNSFRCTAEGYFPDPSVCTRYYVCSGAGGSASQYECPVNYVYNSLARGCRRRTNIRDCVTIDCSRTSNGYVSYTADTAYYAFCRVDGNTRETIMLKCLDDVTSQFDLSTGLCSYRCSSEGTFVNPLDCTGYNECYRQQNGVLNSTSHKCPTNFYYDVDRRQCLRGDCENLIEPPTAPTII